MKVYVVTKTDIFGTRYDIFPDILYFASTRSEAIDVIAKDSKASIYDIAFSYCRILISYMYRFFFIHTIIASSCCNLISSFNDPNDNTLLSQPFRP